MFSLFSILSFPFDIERQGCACYGLPSRYWAATRAKASHRSACSGLASIYASVWRRTFSLVLSPVRIRKVLAAISSGGIVTTSNSVAAAGLDTKNWTLATTTRPYDKYTQTSLGFWIPHLT